MRSRPSLSEAVLHSTHVPISWALPPDDNMHSPWLLQKGSERSQVFSRLPQKKYSHRSRLNVLPSYSTPNLRYFSPPAGTEAEQIVSLHHQAEMQQEIDRFDKRLHRLKAHSSDAICRMPLPTIYPPARPVEISPRSEYRSLKSPAVSCLPRPRPLSDYRDGPSHHRPVSTCRHRILAPGGKLRSRLTKDAQRIVAMQPTLFTATNELAHTFIWDTTKPFAAQLLAFFFR